MHNYVKVEEALVGHPEGTVQLWVKDKHVILTVGQAHEVAHELMLVAGPANAPVEPPAKEDSDATPA
jgi:hypothetical protein